MRSQIPSRFTNVEAARAEHGDEMIEQIIRSVALSDEPADRLIEAFRALPGGAGWRMLDDALAGRAVDGVPPELAELLAPALAPPEWVDLDLVDAGAVAWGHVGALPKLLALTSGSLAYGYGSAGFARPLVRTGRLTQMAPRRLGETARWTLTVTRPGALRPGEDGIHATVRLRLVHALVRAHLRKEGDWDTFNWGEPISIGDIAATGVIGFFIYPKDGLEDLGVRWTPAELEAITHFWSWVSFLMGTPEDYLPGSYDEAVRWAAAARDIDSGGIPESADLVHALLWGAFEFDTALPGPLAAIARQMHAHAFGAAARRWMGDERADELGAPDTPLKHLIPLARPLVRGRDLVRRTGLLGSDERIGAMERALTVRLMDAMGVAAGPLEPEHVEEEPALKAA